FRARSRARVVTVAQRLLQVGGEKRHGPLGAEALWADIVTDGQILADEARARPIGAERNLIFAADWHDVKFARPQDSEIHRKIDVRRLIGVYVRQWSVQSSTQQARRRAREEFRWGCIHGYLRSALDTPNVGEP